MTDEEKKELARLIAEKVVEMVSPAPEGAGYVTPWSPPIIQSDMAHYLRGVATIALQHALETRDSAMAHDFLSRAQGAIHSIRELIPREEAAEEWQKTSHISP